MITVATLSSLYPLISSSRIIIVEGPRCSGKDYLIRDFVLKYPSYQVYEVLKPRKQFLSGVNGNLSNLPADLDIQQSHLWSLDVFRQVNVPVVINRSMLTSFYFDGPHQERLDMWSRMVKDMDAKVVLVLPADRIHAKRIASAGRSAEATSISAEKAGIIRASMACTDLDTNFIRLTEVS